MSGPQALLERRLLAALEAASRIELPAPWDRLRPRDAALRPAAAVLLRIAQRGDRAEMVADLRGIAEDVAARRGGREGGEQALWPQVARAIERLGTLSPGTQGVLGMALWSSPALHGSWAEVGRALRGLLPEPREPGERFLTALARSLLGALARKWTEDAQRKERKERGG